LFVDRGHPDDVDAVFLAADQGLHEISSHRAIYRDDDFSYRIALDDLAQRSRITQHCWAHRQPVTA